VDSITSVEKVDIFAVNRWPNEQLAGNRGLTMV
jgi:hypothetical protein